MTSKPKIFKDKNSEVMDFYDLFPYESNPLEDSVSELFSDRFSVKKVFLLYQDIISPSFNSKINILDAGCGSGLSTKYLASLNPGSDILAIDISQNSLSIAKEKLQKLNSNIKSSVEFREMSLFDLKTININKFDYINSCGLINHIENPLHGLLALEKLLKPNGIIHLLIYAGIGRHKVKITQDLFKCFGVEPLKKDIGFARFLIDNMPKDNYLRIDYHKFWKSKCINDSKFADMYLNPLENSFGLNELFNLIDQTNLKFLGFSDIETWNLERFFDRKVLDLARELPQRKQWKIIECLDESISYFDFFLALKN